MQPPSIVIVAGVNGSGKSTFAATAAGSGALLGLTAINPDDLTKAVSEKLPSLRGVAANLIGVERAEKAVWRAVAEGESAAIETVLSSPKFLPVVRAAKNRGYQTRLVFIAVPTVDIALERIQTRVARGGHAVPAAKVRERWPRSHDNLVEFAKVVDDVFVFSNVGPAPIPVAQRLGGETFTLIDTEALPEVTVRFSKSR